MVETPASQGFLYMQQEITSYCIKRSARMCQRTLCFQNDKKSCQKVLTRKLVMVIMQLSNDKETCQNANKRCQIWNSIKISLHMKEKKVMLKKLEGYQIKTIFKFMARMASDWRSAVQFRKKSSRKPCLQC